MRWLPDQYAEAQSCPLEAASESLLKFALDAAKCKVCNIRCFQFGLMSHFCCVMIV